MTQTLRRRKRRTLALRISAKLNRLKIVHLLFRSGSKSPDKLNISRFLELKTPLSVAITSLTEQKLVGICLLTSSVISPLFCLLRIRKTCLTGPVAPVPSNTVYPWFSSFNAAKNPSNGCEVIILSWCFPKASRSSILNPIILPTVKPSAQAR